MDSFQDVQLVIPSALKSSPSRRILGRCSRRASWRPRGPVRVMQARTCPPEVYARLYFLQG